MRSSQTRYDANGTFAPITYWESSVQPTQGAINAAKRWLIDMGPLIDRARTDSVSQWVIGLALQTAGKGVSVDDAKARAMAYVSTLCDEPAHSFTPATLKAAAKHFTWFPSVAEIVEFLAKETADRRGQTEVARRLAEATAVQPAPPEQRRPMYPVDPPDGDLRRQLSRDRVRRFGQIPEEVEEWRRQMALCAAALGVVSPWSVS